MPSVAIAGGGLAGLAAAAVLGEAGFHVDLLEQRPFPGGRAASYPVSGFDPTIIDNCQHILLRCCTYLLDFYRRLGVSGRIQFSREFHWIEPGGRKSVFRAGVLPVPAHFTESFLGLRFLGLHDKVAIGRAMLAAQRESASFEALDARSMADWLHQHRQPPRAMELFWRQLLVSAVNEELDRMTAWHGLQVIRLGLLATRTASEMGVPDVPLSALYKAEYWTRFAAVRLRFRSAVSALSSEGMHLNDGRVMRADYYVSALPLGAMSRISPELPRLDIDHSPITGVHLWFDRCITELPHATLLDREIQWMFNKGSGRHVELVVSASRSWLQLDRRDIIERSVAQLTEFFPSVREAKLLRAHVTKEVRATIAAAPGTGQRRPGVQTVWPNVFLAGDWTDTRWPSTMEGAVRSGYAAANAVLAAAGTSARCAVAELRQ